MMCLCSKVEILATFSEISVIQYIWHCITWVIVKNLKQFVNKSSRKQSKFYGLFNCIPCIEAHTFALSVKQWMCDNSCWWSMACLPVYLAVDCVFSSPENVVYVQKCTSLLHFVPYANPRFLISWARLVFHLHLPPSHRCHTSCNYTLIEVTSNVAFQVFPK